MKTGFSNRMKDVFTFVREEVIRLGHSSIKVEHLFLGILRDGGGSAIKVLKNLDVEIFHGGHFPSFNKKRAYKIIETYLSGSNTIKEVSKWFKDSQSKGKQIFSDQDWTLAKSIVSQNENKFSS